MKNKILVTLLIALVSVGVINIICLFKPLWLPFERRVYDLKYQFNITQHRNEAIVIIEIDEKSLEKLGRYQNWTRLNFEKVLSQLTSARVVGIDIFFAEPETLPSIIREQCQAKPLNIDSIFEDRIRRNGKVVLVSSFDKPPIFTKHNRTGAGAIFADTDGVVRKGFYKLFEQKTFAAEIGEMVRGVKDHERFLVYYIAENSFRKISFSDVYFQRVPNEYFKDKIVLIGGTAQGLFDDHAVPFDRKFPGIVIQANLINNFINNLKLTEISYILVIALMLILCVIFAYLTITKSTNTYVIVGVVIYVLFLILTFYFFSLRIEFGLIRPTYAFVLTMILGLIYRYQFEEREKRRIKSIFSRYYSRELVEKVIENPPKLGGEKVDCTILFADIRNFTPYAEKTAPENVGMKLNKFLDEMVQVIFDHQGRVDKFIGDCVMAVFGAPVQLENHALNACQAALDMVERAEKLGFNIGVGINSGEVISGNFGSPVRMEYTVIGDAVNLASRLEGQTKEFKCSIVVGEETYHRVSQEKDINLRFKELGRIRVKGKAEEVSVYALSSLLDTS